MIRRDVRFLDGSTGWALISQIEHARISAQLADLCTGRFFAPELASVRPHVLAAIRCHDDGWAPWEASPRLHLDSRKPVSFMELHSDEALAVWSRSIAQAEPHGPLAAWMVAGHFCRLLDIHSPPGERSGPAVAWYDQMQHQRETWLRRWRALDDSLHTAELAAEALQWLWTFDEASLWFCCACPSLGESLAVGHKRFTAGKATPLEMQLYSTGSPGDPRRKRSGLAAAAPWRFAAEVIEVEAAVRVVPAVGYDDAATLLAAGRQRTLRWQFARPTSSPP
ncbi:MAG: DUF3891 family protein [Pirellulales bacterium]|nr:DUF3891 family protein [Pirellulales bacterium]